MSMMRPDFGEMLASGDKLFARDRLMSPPEHMRLYVMKNIIYSA